MSVLARVGDVIVESEHTQNKETGSKNAPKRAIHRRASGRLSLSPDATRRR